MATLSEDVKLYIVTALACFDGQKQVMADVKERFGIAVTHQQVSAYDPATINGKRLSKQYKELYAKTRKEFLKKVDDIPIAQAAYRLRVLDRMARKAEERGNINMAAQLMEQAAKDVGGAFTNRHKVDHAGVVGNMNVPPPAAGTAVAPDEAYKAMLGRK